MQAQKLYRIKGVPQARTGNFRDSRGRAVRFVTSGPTEGSQINLNDLATRYDPVSDQGHTARVKIGHTLKDQDPTHGFVEKLYVEGNTLKADYAAVPEDSVMTLSKTGPYPRRSMEIIDLGGQPYLGDTAHLGANRPAIKGLADVRLSQIEPMSEQEIAALSEPHVSGATEGAWIFSEDDDSTTYTEDEMANDGKQPEFTAEEQSAFKKMLAFASNMFSGTKADETKPQTAELSEEQQREFTELKVEQAKLKEQIALGAAEKKARQFCDDNRSKLGVVPIELAVAVLAFADTKCPQIEYDGKTQSFGEFLRCFMSELPDGPVLTELQKLSEPEDFKPGDFSSEAIYARTKKLAADKGISYSEARDIVLKEAN